MPVTKDRRAASATPADRAAAAPDATALLAADHREVHERFGEYERRADGGASAAELGPLAEEICNLLTVHATIEEEIFYPAAREAGVDSDLLDEAEVEHASAKALVAQIREMKAGDELYDAKVKVLGEYVDHHVAEEQDELFPKCRASAMDLAEVGARLAARKSELMSEMSEGMEVVG